MRIEHGIHLIGLALTSPDTHARLSRAVAFNIL